MGAVACLVKPVLLTTLLDALRRIARRHESRERGWSNELEDRRFAIHEPTQIRRRRRRRPRRSDALSMRPVAAVRQPPSRRLLVERLPHNQPPRARHKPRSGWRRGGHSQMVDLGKSRRDRTLQAFTDDFNKRTPSVKAELVPLRQRRLRSQNADTAQRRHRARCLLRGDSLIGKLIQSKTIIELTEPLKGATSKSKPEDFFEGLWGAAKTGRWQNLRHAGRLQPDGLLVQQEGPAGCRESTQMPADMAKDDKWTWDAFQTMLEQIVAKGKRGFIHENGLGRTSSGPRRTAARSGMAGSSSAIGSQSHRRFPVRPRQPPYEELHLLGVAAQGPGHGRDVHVRADCLHLAGRWLLPVFKKTADLEFDIVTFPTNTGKKDGAGPDSHGLCGA